MDRTLVVGVKKLGVLLAALAAVMLAAFVIAAPAWSQANARAGDVNIQYVDCSQVQAAAVNQNQYGDAVAIGDGAAAAIAQELNISQEQVNACLGNIGNNDDTTKDDTTKDDTTKDDTTIDDTTIDDTTKATGDVLSSTIPEKKVLAATGGPASMSGIVAFVMLGAGLLLGSAVRRDR